MTHNRRRRPLLVPPLIVSGAALALTAARIIWPKMAFDSVSLTLFGIAAAGLLLAYLPLRKLKFGDFEAELDAAVDSLEKKVVAGEGAARATAAPTISAALAAGPGSWRGFFDEYLQIAKSGTSNVEKIVALAILLEKVVSTTAAALYPDRKDLRGTRAIINQIASDNLIAPAEREAFLEFWEIRNRVVHEGIGLNDEQTARILDLAGRLVGTFA